MAWCSHSRGAAGVYERCTLWAMRERGGKVDTYDIVSAGAGRACEACSQRPAERPSACAGATRRFIDSVFCFCKGSLCFREMTSRPALIPFCPQDFPFRFPVWRVHAPCHPPPQKFFCTLLYISIAHASHNICHFCASERTIH